VVSATNLIYELTGAFALLVCNASSPLTMLLNVLLKASEVYSRRLTGVVNPEPA